MGMLPLDRMWERVEIARQDSDTSLFFSLLYCGEMVSKIVAAGLVAAIEDDRERHRYRQIHRLVRANGIGDWASTVNDILTGPAAQHLAEQAREEQRQLTIRVSQGAWQADAVKLMHSCVCLFRSDPEELSTKVDGRKWLSLFSVLRNDTRGHGAPAAQLCSQACPQLEQSIRIFVDNFRLFARPWAYLHRNLSGKYNVTKLTQPAAEFDSLKTKSAGENLADGVYVYFAKPVLVDLVCSSIDAQDFFFPNGAFVESTFELISYVTGNKKDADATPYLSPATALPESETQGIGELDVQGKGFGNLPPAQNGYIRRTSLETELYNVVMDDRHPIVTLVGRGGIGKTWLTLTVLHSVANQERFAAILWFSARDIDLMQHGPKLVMPHVLSTRDIAKEFVRLIQPTDRHTKGFDGTTYLATMMTKSTMGPILFVFDNFETVRFPAELYSWVDTYVRSPNKVLITTRLREFKGDYPIEVGGMNEQESEELIRSTATTLGIRDLLTPDYVRELHEESGGHPYVMKVLLGEVAKAGKLAKVARIVATFDEILDALFERTFASLSPVGKRVFLTLCSWRSSVPLLALEAVLLRPINERMDVSAAAEELSRSSFVETTQSIQDGERFLTVPLVAMVFGKRKLATSPMKSAIESDTELLLAFGATQQSEIGRGVSPRVDRLFRFVADRITESKDTLENHLPMLEFISRKYPPAWLLLSQLYQELESDQDSARAKEAIRRYIEATPADRAQQQEAWEELGRLCRQTGDWEGEIHALVEICQLPGIPFRTVSSSVNRVNALFSDRNFELDSEEKRIVSRRLAQVMETRIDEGDATDCSRLAWLFIRLGEEEKARTIVGLGLSHHPDNIHCNNLLEKLNAQHDALYQ